MHSPSLLPVFRSFWLLALLLMILVGLTHLSIGQVGAFQPNTKAVFRHPTMSQLAAPSVGTPSTLMEPRILVSPLEFYVEHSPAPDKSIETLTIENQGSSV